MRLRRPSRTRRGLALPVAAVVALCLALGGCSVLQRPGSAAIVDGTSISVKDVATATAEWNRTVATTDDEGPLSEARVAGYLLLSRFIENQVAASGSWKPDAAYNLALARLKSPSPSTVELLRTKLALSSLTREDVQAIVARLKASDIQLDPRYGTFDPETGGAKPAAEDLPNWIVPPKTPQPGQ